MSRGVGGGCGAPPASAPLPVAAPLPQRPVGQGRGAAEHGSGERMGRKLSEKGKKTMGARSIL
jgi:hypothetical protein